MFSWSKILGLIGKIYIVIMSLASIITGIGLAVYEESLILFVLIAIGGILFTIVSSAFIMTFAEIGDNIYDIKKKTEEQNMCVVPSNPNMYKVRVLKSFKDTELGVTHSVGDIFEVTKERFDEIISSGPLIENVNKQSQQNKRYVGFGQYE